NSHSANSEFAEMKTMGAAREKRRAERIVEGGTPAWHYIWARLKASGWTHKKPPASSIETRWKFIPPGGKESGVEGKDYFLGEDRVIAHYAAATRPNASAIAISGDGAGLTPPVDESEAPNVNPSFQVSPPAATSNLTGSPPPTSREVNASDGDIESGNGTSSDDSEEDELELVPRRAGPLRLQRKGSLFSDLQTKMIAVAKLLCSMMTAEILTTYKKVSMYLSCIYNMSSSIMSSDSEDDINKIEEGHNPDDFAGFEFSNETVEDGIADEDDSDEEGEGAVAAIGRG
ncbi:hypothetical protein GN958_ATG07831, partial [Phytophthora infestans]